MVDEGFYVLNYKFAKTFSEGTNNDWIISHINHVNLSDEEAAQRKSITDLMKKAFSKNDDENKKK